MCLRRRPLSAIRGLTLVLALTGLLAMHGLDAGSVTAGDDGGVMTSTMRQDLVPGAGVAQPSGAMPDSAGSDRSEATRGERHVDAAGAAAPGHVGLGHVVAMCVAVVVAATTTAVRHLARGALARFGDVACNTAGRLVRALDAPRPSGPARLELCILLC